MHSSLPYFVRVLIAAGIANLILSFALGFALSSKRLREPITKHHWLLTAHVVSLQEGLMLLGLAFAGQYAVLPAVWLTSGAWLLAAGSAFQDSSGIVNWLRRTNDQFAERSFGWQLATVNAVLNTAGLGIMAVGVFRGVAG